MKALIVLALVALSGCAYNPYVSQRRPAVVNQSLNGTETCYQGGPDGSVCFGQQVTPYRGPIPTPVNPNLYGHPGYYRNY